MNLSKEQKRLLAAKEEAAKKNIKKETTPVKKKPEVEAQDTTINVNFSDILNGNKVKK